MKKLFKHSLFTNILTIVLFQFLFTNLHAQFTCNSNPNLSFTLENGRCNILLEDLNFGPAMPHSVCPDVEHLRFILLDSKRIPIVGRKSFTPGIYTLFWDVSDACGFNILCQFTTIVKFPDGILNCSQVVPKVVAINTMCGNGDFESGTINSAEWSEKHGNNNIAACLMFPMTCAICNYLDYGMASSTTTFLGGPLFGCGSHQTIVSKAVDPTVGILTVAPVPSINNYSVRLGNTTTIYGQEALIKEFTVMPGATSLSFWYASIFENSGHQGDRLTQPSFKTIITSQTTGMDLSNLVDLGNGINELVSDGNDPFFHIFDYIGIIPNIVYKDWSCVNVDLKDHVGELITIEFRNRDCRGGGHWGYTYLDNICVGCPSGVIALDSASCLPGDICLDYTLPILNGVSGQCRFILNVYRNNLTVYSDTSGFLSTGNNYCFHIDTCELLDEDLYDYNIRVDCSVPAPPCPLTPPPIQNPIHLPVLYLGKDSTGVIPGLNNDIATCCINCCDSVIIFRTDSCCSHLESTCEVSSINISVTNGTISDLFWNCGTIPAGYLGSTNFTYTPTVACPLALDLCVNASGLNPMIITYTITFISGSTCIKTETKNCPCSQISGELWHDIDNDGIQETGEPALVGYTVNLIDLATGNIIMFTSTASPNGSYSFSCMPPGKYYVQFVPPPGYEPSPFNTSGSTTDSDIDHINGTYNTDIFIVNNGDTIQNLDAGLFNCCDFVLIEDTNDSCCSRINSLCAVDSIKVNVQNGTISLISWNCAPRLNNYAFSGLSNFTLGIPNNCPLSFGVCVDPIYTNPYAPVIITYTVYSSSGAVCTKYDTLFCPCAVITGEAWYDSNGDGIYQQAENGINGMLIQLVDAMTGKTVSTMETITRPGTSSDDGYYAFPCVKPGMYYIRFDSFAGLTNSTPFQGGNAETDSDITGTYGPYTTYKITVMNGDTINNIDGGYKDSSIVSIGHLTIAGLIITETTKAMLPSRVNLATANNSNNKTEWSHYSGNYAFSDLTAGQDYRISVENNDAPLQGVSTRDIVLIQKHILGIKYLDSPYKIIAADVNNSQSITASDLVELRKLILGVIETFPKNKSWRFVPKNYVFKNPTYPFPFEENILHSKMENNKMNTDFYAVKIGDVSGNALDLVNTSIRSVKSVQLIFEKASYKKNEEISVPVRLSEGDMLSGIQIALQLSDELEFVTIEKGSLNINQENYRFNRSQLLISYNEARGFDVGKKDIFTLKLKAKTDLNIDKKINSSNLLENEAYDLADQVVPLEVINSVENIKTTSGVYQFYPAKPNPFKQETMIEFELPNEEAIIFTVYNPEGKLVWSKEKMYISGNNQMSISKEDLGHSGLYYLHIQSKEFCKTQRILMLD